ncbi:lipid-transfer protein [Paeniglutamicibacter gangotriensis]|uniref:Lipid-transfer protein n=1 Tax=Paeniglutamicibacter gangotriensis TaxID=254787 RepID=A0A5B0E4D9_9MICC|nr:lipid-transfer protein [Paeniglutamicibacter gangotriensis]KAA0972761.1 lipid-transfer protein [Paeniglutamicibacter gangotriensis]
MSNLLNKAVIVGIGATEFSKNSGRSELQLAQEASLAACRDAGVDPHDVDGMVTYSMDTNPAIEVARGLGCKELNFFSHVDYGGGAAAGTILHAAMAVATGVAKTVVCYRAFNERSGARFGQAMSTAGMAPDARAASYAWTLPFGLMTPASWVGMFAQRYMHLSGATSEDFGRIAVADRKHAATNPKAWFYGKPITLEDHQASRWIADPLHLLDCCQESDGGQAFVITTPERARDLRGQAVTIKAAAQGAAYDQHSMVSYYRKDGDRALPEMGNVAAKLWNDTGLTPEDIDTAVLYDHFTPFVLAQLEEFGFCGRFEAKDFIKNGAIELGGRLPINTNGGQLGEAYIHGMNGIAEGVRQIRGTAVNQVPNARNVLVSAGTGVPTSALILGND